MIYLNNVNFVLKEQTLLAVYNRPQRQSMKNRSVTKTNTNLQTNDEKLKIVIRIRPVLNEEQPSMFVRLEDNDTLEIRRPGNHSYMKFNNILPPESNQKELFALMEDSIRQFLSGTNTTIFAYGQTGAGKTYSIIGNYSPNDSQQNLFNFLSSKERGVLSRSLETIMAASAKSPSSRFYVSFYQIYNEKIYDLYNYTNVGLDIRESKNGQISIPDLVTVQINSMADAIDFLMVGLKNRATGSTHANAKSSRSHSVFQISMEKKEGNELISSSLRIVDLAGSQKFKIPSDLTPAEKEIRIQQLTSINGSLSCLGHCISALIQKSRTHIPFRNSKLTRILSDSLLGHGKMRFIICISPSVTASAETFSTLQFANRAKKAIFDRVDRTPSAGKKKSESQQMINLRSELNKQRQLRSKVERQLQQLKNRFENVSHENNRLNSKIYYLQQQKIVTHNNHKQSDHHSKMSFYNHQKQNDFKEQMLKLTIFQRNRPQGLHSPSPTKTPTKLSTMSHSQISHNPGKSLNKKKAQFQKKIKKFIQSDSPSHNIPNKSHQQDYSFQSSDFDHKLSDHNPRRQITQTPIEQREEDIWDSQKDDSSQLIQKACNKMNLSQFNQLKSQMQRARKELLNLRMRDNQIQQRKLPQ